MSVLKELFAELQLFAQTFLGFLSFMLWAWIGRLIAKYTGSRENPDQPFKLSTFITEIPIAIGMGIGFGGVTEFLVNQQYIKPDSLLQPALIGLGAYLGPKVFEDAWKSYFNRNSHTQTTEVHIDGHDHSEDNQAAAKPVSQEELVSAIKEFLSKEEKENNEDNKKDSSE